MTTDAETRVEGDAVSTARDEVDRVAGAVGDRHADYAAALYQLAFQLIMRGDADAAEPLLREALGVRGEALGQDHPDYATNLSSLGGILWARGALDEAEPLLRQAADIRLAALGPRHPSTVVSLDGVEQLREARRDEDVPPVPAAPAEGPGRPSADGLEAEVRDLAADFAALAARLNAAARGLMGEGELPPASLSEACAEARARFGRLRAATLEAVGESGIALGTDDLAGLEAIAAALPALREAEAARVEWARVRLAALGALDRVERLSCPGDPNSGILAACLERVSRLREVLASDATPGGDGEAGRLAAGDHPLADLLALAGSDDSVDDAEWAGWYDSVAATFGTPLAVAAARSRLVEARG